MSESLLEELFNLEESFKGKINEFIKAVEEIQKKGIFPSKIPLFAKQLKLDLTCLVDLLETH